MPIFPSVFRALFLRAMVGAPILGICQIFDFLIDFYQGFGVG